MRADLAGAAEWFGVLHDYNNQGPSLAARLLSEDDRFERFSRCIDGLLLDFSRCAIDDQVFSALIELAARSGVEAERERRFGGEQINFTEHRAVLHPLWRGQNFADLPEAGEARELGEALARMRVIAASLNGGRLHGDSGPPRARHIVHIGIGGSLLGPRLL